MQDAYGIELHSDYSAEARTDIHKGKAVSRYQVGLYTFFKQSTYRVSEGKVFFLNLALRERNIQVRLYLKVVLKSLDVDILIIRTNFQKSNIGWPQQPPTEKIPNVSEKLDFS